MGQDLWRASAGWPDESHSIDEADELFPFCASLLGTGADHPGSLWVGWFPGSRPDWRKSFGIVLGLLVTGIALAWPQSVLGASAGICSLRLLTAGSFGGVGSCRNARGGFVMETVARGDAVSRWLVC